MKCLLTSRHPCPGNRDAEVFVEWTMALDPDPATCHSVLCQKCLDNRPSFIRIMSTRPVQEGDRCSA